MKLDDLYDYRKAVSFYADMKKNNVLSNEGEKHAIIIFENIFRTADSKICIYAQDIFANGNDVTTSKDYVEEMCRFLSKPNTSMQILLQDYNEETSYNVLRDSIKKYSDKITVKVNKKKIVKIKTSKIHFCIADGRMYRMEYNTGNRMARCNFNDADTVARLQDIYSKLFNDEDSLRVNL